MRFFVHKPNHHALFARPLARSSARPPTGGFWLDDCWRHTGNIQFLATAKGFRVYVTGTRILTPSYAENHMWTVAWIGFPATDFPRR